jgi:hypothetical protein
VAFSFRRQLIHPRLKDQPKLREICQFDKHRLDNAPRRNGFQFAIGFSPCPVAPGFPRACW